MTLYYFGCPSMVRIISEKLCLDHTFSPLASNKGGISGVAAFKLLKNPLIDRVHIYINEEAAGYYDPFNENKWEWMPEGWYDLSNFDDIKNFTEAGRIDPPKRKNNEENE